MNTNVILGIETPDDYIRAMEVIETYLAKGSANMDDADLAELQRLSLLVERYEEQHYPMPLVPDHGNFIRYSRNG